MPKTTLFVVIEVEIEHGKDTTPDEIIDDCEYDFPSPEGHNGEITHTEMIGYTEERPIV